MGRARRIGGNNRTQKERQPAMERFWAEAEPEVTSTWVHQCFCGSVEVRKYRGAFWCAHCGREMPNNMDVSSAQAPEGLARGDEHE